MKYLLLSLTIFLAGCTINSNPGGMTARERLRTEAQVEIARAQERAAIGVAEAEAGAIIAKHSMWTGVLPMALVIVVVGVLGALYINWSGRHTLAKIERTPPAVTISQSPPTPTIGELRRLARAQGYTLQIEGNYAYLMDGQEKKGRLQLTG